MEGKPHLETVLVVLSAAFDVRDASSEDAFAASWRINGRICIRFGLSILANLRYIKARGAIRLHLSRIVHAHGQNARKDLTVPLLSILILTGVIVAFVIFGVTLAWGDYQTRVALRERARHPTPPKHPDTRDDDVKLAA